MYGRNLESTPVAILAGGLATRLLPVTESIPKAMVPVGGRPFLGHQLEYLRAQGIRRAVICAGHLGSQIQEHFGDGSLRGLALEYSFDGPALLGTAGALRKALPLLGTGPFFVLYGDSWLPTPFGPVLDAFHAAFQTSGAAALMTVFHNRGRWGQSNVWFEDGRIRAYDKRRPVPQMEHIDYGLSVFRPEYLTGAPSDLADLFSVRLPAGFEVHERFHEIGSPAGLEELRHEFQ